MGGKHFPVANIIMQRSVQQISSDLFIHICVRVVRVRATLIYSGPVFSAAAGHVHYRVFAHSTAESCFIIKILMRFEDMLGSGRACRDKRHDAIMNVLGFNTRANWSVAFFVHLDCFNKIIVCMMYSLQPTSTNEPILLSCAFIQYNWKTYKHFIEILWNGAWCNKKPVIVENIAKSSDPQKNCHKRQFIF